MATADEPVLARFAGVCELCGDMIRAGKDKLVLIEEDCWVHLRCAVEEGYVKEVAGRA